MSVNGSRIYSSRLSSTLLQLEEISDKYKPSVLANGFGPESMLLTDLISRHRFAIDIISLDTGRLPKETYELAQAAFVRYGPIIQLISPDPNELEPWVRNFGPNAFYESVDRRKECCAIRKINPLKRALKGKKAWVTGLRKEQAANRMDLDEHSWDSQFGLEKFNPMLNWSSEELWAYLHDFSVPYNSLFDQGYKSVGCAPCSRAVKPDEDSRVGRWWWERDTLKECGLHFDQKTKTLKRNTKQQS